MKLDLIALHCVPFKQDPSEIQVRIGVDDVDDNLPIFKEGNLTVGKHNKLFSRDHKKTFPMIGIEL